MEMSEFLPDKLTLAEYNTGEYHTSSQKQKHKVLSTMEWGVGKILTNEVFQEV